MQAQRIKMGGCEADIKGTLSKEIDIEKTNFKPYSYTPRGISSLHLMRRRVEK